MRKKILILVIGFYGIASCSKSSSSTGGGGGGGGSTLNCSTVPALFGANVSSIISTSCATNAGCHGAGSINGPGPLLTHAQISAASAAIKVAVSNGTMPKTGTLTTDQKNTIICWVNAGALNN